MLRVSLGSRVFAPTLVPTLLLLPALGLLLSLGHWQLDRAAEKRALVAAFARASETPIELPRSGEPRYARIRVTGRYLADRQILLDNMTHAGTGGYRVLTPLMTTDGTVLLVDRGWVAAGPRRNELPDVHVAGDARELTGRLDELPAAGVTLGHEADTGWPQRLSFPDRARLEQLLGHPLYPKIVLLDPGAPDGYLRDWRPGGIPPERHLGYAVQWYALALTLLIIYVVVNLKRPEAAP